MSPTKQTLLAIIIAILLSAVIYDIATPSAPWVKFIKLHECVRNTEGTDTDCDSCYYEIYGTYPD